MTTVMDALLSDLNDAFEAAAPKLEISAGPPEDGAVVALIAAIGRPIPEELQVFFARYGRADAFPLSEAADYRSLGPEGALARWSEMKEVLSSGAFEKRKPKVMGRGPSLLRRVFWHEGWLPIGADSGGNLLCMDLDPAAGGVHGQLFFFEVDEGPLPPHRPNLTDHLRHVLGHHRAYGLSFDEASGLLGPAPRAPGLSLEEVGAMTAAAPFDAEITEALITLVDEHVDQQAKVKALDYLELPEHLAIVTYHHMLSYYLDRGGLATYVKHQEPRYHEQVLHYLEMVGDTAVGALLTKAMAGEALGPLDESLTDARPALLARVATAMSAHAGRYFAERNLVSNAMSKPLAIHLVDAMLDAGYPVNQPDADGRTLLEVAVSPASKNLEVTRRLLDAGADVNRRRGGWAPLHIAANDPELVPVLVAAGAEVDAINSQGETPLLTVLNGAAHVNLAAVEALLDAGAALDVFDDHFRSPLHGAATKGLLSVVRRTLDAGQGPNQPARTIGSDYLPLYGAVAEGHGEVVALLLDRGANATFPRPPKSRLKPLASLAVGRGDAVLLETLLERGADANAVDAHGWSALHLAIVKDQPHAVAALVAAGADRELASTKKRKLAKKTFDAGTTPKSCAEILGKQAVLTLG